MSGPGWRAVQVATISEEDVAGERVGEDGMVETIEIMPNDAQQQQQQDTDTGAAAARTTEETNEVRAATRETPHPERPKSLERPSSMVEKECEDDEATSVLRAISFENVSSTLPRASPSVTRPRTPASPTTRSPPAATLPARSRLKMGTKSKAFTMSLSDKFVTELTLSDPCGGVGGGAGMCLGVFVATDQSTGDHSVYKMSPVSPLTALKISPQDRILKINGLSVAGWSHHCLLDFVRSLSLIHTTNHTSPFNSSPNSTSPVEVRLSLEYQRAGRNVRAATEVPITRVVDVTLALARRRATVTSVQEKEWRLQYRDTALRRLRVDGVYMAASVAQPGASASVVLAGDQPPDNVNVRFRVHNFEGPEAAEGELLVVLEAAGSFLCPVSPTRLAFLQGGADVVQSLARPDVRFFRLTQLPGRDVYRIRSHSTGNFVSVSSGKLEMIPRPEDGELPHSTIFEILPS